jgi:hypothetical protein
MYALQYLMRTLKDLIIVYNRSRLTEECLTDLPICLNDTAYNLVAERLVLSVNKGIKNIEYMFSVKRFALQRTGGA